MSEVREQRRRGLVSMGVGLAAAGVGAAIGLAAERAAVGRAVRPEGAPGGPAVPHPAEPAFGTLRGAPMSVATDDGATLHVEVDDAVPATTGRSRAAARPADPLPTIVLCHGFALSMDSWHYQRAALRGSYRLVLWDHRGHGRSTPGPAGMESFGRIAEDLATVIGAAAPTGPLVLLGHSMGGMTIMALARLRPELFAERVIGVGLISTSAGQLGRADLGVPGFGQLVMKVAPVAVRALARSPRLVAGSRRLGSDLEGVLVRRYSFGSKVSPELVTFAAQMIASTSVPVLSQFLPALSTHDEREALSVLDGIETLVMVGDADLLTPPEQSEEIMHRLPGAEHVIVHDGGHLLMLEHPEVVTQHVVELLQRSLRANAGRPLPPGGRVRRSLTPLRRLGRGDRSGAA